MHWVSLAHETVDNAMDESGGGARPVVRILAFFQWPCDSVMTNGTGFVRSNRVPPVAKHEPFATHETEARKLPFFES